jgi:hypothetical protein
LFSVAKHLLPAGAVVDDRTVNATSVHKPETECDFFVKIVNAVLKPHKHGLFTPFGLALTRLLCSCPVVHKTCTRAKRYRFTPFGG